MNLLHSVKKMRVAEAALGLTFAGANDSVDAIPIYPHHRAIIDCSESVDNKK